MWLRTPKKLASPSEKSPMNPSRALSSVCDLHADIVIPDLRTNGPSTPGRKNPSPSSPLLRRPSSVYTSESGTASMFSPGISPSKLSTIDRSLKASRPMGRRMAACACPAHHSASPGSIRAMRAARRTLMKVPTDGLPKRGDPACSECRRSGGGRRMVGQTDCPAQPDLRKNHFTPRHTDPPPRPAPADGSRR